jgi:hypothetical protein
VCPKFIRKIGKKKKKYCMDHGIYIYIFFWWIGHLDDESLQLDKSLYATRDKSIPEKGVGRG